LASAFTSAPHSAADDPAAPVVVFDKVSIAFEDNQVLQDISFSVYPGETRIILGPAGCGKSVLLKLVDGLLRPDSGSIRVFGADISSLTKRQLYALRARIGMVFQESALFDSLNVRDNVAYRMLEEHVPAQESEARVRESLRFVELEDAIDKFPSELSGGMRRRVAIARAVVSHPDLILYDSPTAGLDPITSSTIIELLVKQRDVSRTTALAVTHRMQDAFTLATHAYDSTSHRMVPMDRHGPTRGIDPRTRYLVLKDGRVVFDGDTQALVATPDPWLRDFIS
jgi:phospholipid/cholesterol/gamma-HCH transport system ATP-binding protein